MAAPRLDLATLRRGVGAALVVFLLVCAVLYYRAPPSSPVAAPDPGTPPASSAPAVSPEAGPPPSTATPGPSGSSGTPSARAPRIEIHRDHATTAKAFATVRLHGTYHGGPETFLRVEVREGARWTAFPLRPKTDHLGRFITHVELADPGPHWLRVVHPEARIASEPFVLVIEA